ncbi:MAG: DUF3558 family protein [Nitrospira sp.]|nr:DUF3558 family protein [Nitrospira sp.]
MEKFQQMACHLLLALTVAGCSGETERAEKVSSPGTTPVASTSTSAAPSSGLCSLFTTEEIKELLGAPVGAGKVAGPMDTACHWSGSTDADAVYAQIQVVNDTRYWSKPTLAKGYEALSGISKEDFVVPELDGWSASAVTDTAVVSVAVNGGTADREAAVRLLRRLLERLR